MELSAAPLLSCELESGLLAESRELERIEKE